MQQMQMFDPREAPVATEAMLADRDLRRAIAAMRWQTNRENAGWPYVEAVEGNLKVWVVDDSAVRYVVVGAMIYEPSDLEVLNTKTRAAALAVFARLDTQVAA